MIIPPLCQSCGQPIGHLWETYKILVQKYAEETGQISSVEDSMSRQPGIVKKKGRGRPKKSDSEGGAKTEQQPAKGSGSETERSPEYQALAELAEKHGFNPERYCCRFMFLCNHDISDVVH